MNAFKTATVKALMIHAKTRPEKYNENAKAIVEDIFKVNVISNGIAADHLKETLITVVESRLHSLGP